MKTGTKTLVGALILLLSLTLPTLALGDEPAAPLPADGEVCTDAVAISDGGVAQVAGPEAAGIGCITCGIDSWCDQWCGPGKGRCAQNLSCGPFYKKYCYCTGELE
jgi:hypothetical protein